MKIKSCPTISRANRTKSFPHEIRIENFGNLQIVFSNQNEFTHSNGM
jgi:hypothetical protein